MRVIEMTSHSQANVTGERVKITLQSSDERKPTPKTDPNNESDKKSSLSPPTSGQTNYAIKNNDKNYRGCTKYNEGKGLW